jgi:hypothetical protein
MFVMPISAWLRAWKTLVKNDIPSKVLSISANEDPPGPFAIHLFSFCRWFTLSYVGQARLAGTFW